MGSSISFPTVERPIYTNNSTATTTTTTSSSTTMDEPNYTTTNSTTCTTMHEPNYTTNSTTCTTMHEPNYTNNSTTTTTTSTTMHEPNYSNNSITTTASTTMHEPNYSNNSTTTSTTMDEPNYTNKPSKASQPHLYTPPGKVLFRLLCHVSRIGGLIGKSGSVIKNLEQRTNSRIRVEDPVSESHEHRVVTVVASASVVSRIRLDGVDKDDGESNEGGGGEWFAVSAAQEGLVRVFERVVEVSAEGDDADGIGGVVSCRMLVRKGQVQAVIGKERKVVERIRKDTGCSVILTSEKFPSCPSDEIVEIEGNVLSVKKALVAVTACIQEFPSPKKTRVYGTRPHEAEPLPARTVDLPLQRNPELQPMPSHSINHALAGGSSTIDSRTQLQEVIFKILCPNEVVGSVLGKGGSIVKALQNESGAAISVGPTVPECHERLITITAMESVESQYSPAQKAVVLIFNRYIEAGLAKGLNSSSKGSHVSARVMVSPNQVGCLLGKGGAIISRMRKSTGTGLRFIGGNLVPKCASENGEVLQITGEFANVQDALYKVTSRLRDRTFLVKKSIGNEHRISLRAEDSPCDKPRDPPRGPHLSLGIADNPDELKYFENSMDHLGVSGNTDRPPSPRLLSSLAISEANQENILDNGRKFPSAKGAVELGSGSRTAIATNTTVEIVIPGSVFGSIFGADSNNLARLRQISGAKVIELEPRPGTGDRTLVISGTPDQTQAAQSLLHAFIL